VHESLRPNSGAPPWCPVHFSWCPNCLRLVPHVTATSTHAHPFPSSPPTPLIRLVQDCDLLAGSKRAVKQANAASYSIIVIFPHQTNQTEVLSTQARHFQYISLICRSVLVQHARQTGIPLGFICRHDEPRGRVREPLQEGPCRQQTYSEPHLPAYPWQRCPG